MTYRVTPHLSPHIPRPLIKLTMLALFQHMAVPSIVGHRCTVSILANFHITRRYQPFLLHLQLAVLPHTASISVCALSRSSDSPGYTAACF